MIELGKMQTLTAVKRTSNGLYLGDSFDNSCSKTVLLPNNELDEDSAVGDDFNVFVYKDSKDRIIATTIIPYITLNRFATLTVKEISPIGAFLDWGLAKDLLLPFREQKSAVKAGDKVFVTLYIDKSNRLCATTKVYELLRCDSPYRKDDIVTGTVYEINERLGAFVAVDDKYNSLIPTSHLITTPNVGDTVSAYVTNVRDDGKLTLSLSGSATEHMDSDADYILYELKNNDGFLPYNDKSDSNVLRDRFNMSKNSFKRAIGRLYKQRKIEITDKGIRLV